LENIMELLVVVVLVAVGGYFAWKKWGKDKV
jgi:predicted negative regulator of RcsB-dependent stress response